MASSSLFLRHIKLDSNTGGCNSSFDEDSMEEAICEELESSEDLFGSFMRRDQDRGSPTERNGAGSVLLKRCHLCDPFGVPGYQED